MPSFRGAGERPAAISNGGNGNTVIAEAVRRHAAELEPESPWRAFRAFGILDHLAVDAMRAKTLPPGFGAVEAAQFLARPPGC